MQFTDFLNLYVFRHLIRLWLSHNEIVKEDVHPHGIEGTGYQTYIPSDMVTVCSTEGLVAIDIECQAVADTISANVVGGIALVNRRGFHRLVTGKIGLLPIRNL